MTSEDNLADNIREQFYALVSRVKELENRATADRHDFLEWRDRVAKLENDLGGITEDRFVSKIQSLDNGYDWLRERVEKLESRGSAPGSARDRDSAARPEEPPQEAGNATFRKPPDPPASFGATGITPEWQRNLGNLPYRGVCPIHGAWTSFSGPMCPTPHKTPVWMRGVSEPTDHSKRHQRTSECDDPPACVPAQSN